MVKKLLGVGCLLFALGVAARPAPAADLFPCSCALLRRYNPTRDDHAIFPESQLAASDSAGAHGISRNKPE